MITKKTTAVKKAARKTTRVARGPGVGVAAPVPDARNENSVEPATALSEAGKQKLVRDSFTMPKREYEQLGALKMRLVNLSHAIKKGELLRAGVAALTAMSDVELITAIERVQRLKTGRPKNAKPAEKKSAKKRA